MAIRQQAAIVCGALLAAFLVLASFSEAQDTSTELLSKKRAFTTFDAPGADGTFAWSINAAGVITGDYIDDSAVPHGFGAPPVAQ
jgi:hypothetical protein